jgi:peptidylprolyl isomerase
MPKRLPRTLGDSANRLTLSKEVPVRFTARPVALALAASLSAVALVGCSPASSTCINPFGEGSASLVSVSGPFGSTPIVDFPTPFVGRDASIATVIPGTGDVIESGYFVDFEATIFGGDETILTATTYGANDAPAQRIPIAAGSNAISDAFLCHSAGERFALTGTAAEIFGATSGSGTDPNATVVVVFDVINAYPGSSRGIPQFAQDGMPAVTSAPDGRPGIAVPDIAPPTELRISTLTKGDGPVISEGQTVVAHYTGVVWGGAVFDSSWDANRPVDLVAQSFVDNAGVGVVPGFAKALIGQTVGSRVLVAIPPSEGYPAGQEPSSIPANATMIFVIDILGTN